jgi:hypothetical protein
MENNTTYTKTTLPTDRIIINPDNARFYDRDVESLDDIVGMNNIIELDHAHVINLAKDIAKNGLLPNQSPIVMPLKSKSGYYLTYDGNRRLTSLKLITTYKNDLNKFSLTTSEKEILSQLESTISRIECIVSEDESYVNQLLLKIHGETTPGLRQVNWLIQAKAKHMRKTSGEILPDLAFLHLLENISAGDTTLLDIIHSGKWVSKMKRFLNNKKNMLLLGLEFTTNSRIICYFQKDSSNALLIKFLKKVNNEPASKIAQTVQERNNFLAAFITENKLDKLHLNNMQYIYDPYTNTFSLSNIPLNKDNFNKNLIAFKKKHIVSTDSTGSTDSTDSTGSTDSTDSTDSENTIPHSEKGPSTAPASSDQSAHTPSQSIPAATPTPSKRKKYPTFFSQLKYNNINATDTKTLPLLKICKEIQSFSKGPYHAYQKYPIAATVLFRSLVEQCFKYLLRKSFPTIFNDLKNKNAGQDPLLGDLIKKISFKKKDIFTDPATLRNYNALFDGTGFKDGLDLAAHHSRTDVDFLEEKAQNFILIADHILNTELKNLEP